MKLIHVVVVLWVGVSIVGIFAYSQSSMIDFDDQRLYHESQDVDFDSVFSQFAATTLNQSIENTVLHFSSAEGCFCEFVAQKHIQSVAQLAEGLGKQNLSLNLNEQPDWQIYVPATPAIAVFDDNGRLSYLGPYAMGTGCFTGNGIVEKHLSTTVNQGATIPLDASGCYCRT